MEYQSSFYGSICKLNLDGTISNCITRFNNRQINLPDVEHLVKKAYLKKEVIFTDEGEVVSPIIKAQTQDVEFCLILLNPKNGYKRNECSCYWWGGVD